MGSYQLFPSHWLLPRPPLFFLPSLYPSFSDLVLCLRELLMLAAFFSCLCLQAVFWVHTHSSLAKPLYSILLFFPHLSSDRRSILFFQFLGLKTSESSGLLSIIFPHPVCLELLLAPCSKCPAASHHSQAVSPAQIVIAWILWVLSLLICPSLMPVSSIKGSFKT